MVHRSVGHGSCVMGHMGQPALLHQVVLVGHGHGSQVSGSWVMGHRSHGSTSTAASGRISGSRVMVDRSVGHGSWVTRVKPAALLHQVVLVGHGHGSQAMGHRSHGSTSTAASGRISGSWVMGHGSHGSTSTAASGRISGSWVMGHGSHWSTSTAASGRPI